VRFLRRAAAPPVSSPLTDVELRALLIEDVDRGWRAFIDQYTPALLAAIERAGIRDQDEAMELYTLACERLAADDCARLRRHDPSKGALGSWLTVLIRNVVVDWVRSRAGRRRLFKSIQGLSALDQRVFELFYWENQTTSEMVGLLGEPFGSPTLAAVLEALERVQAALTERQRAELVAMGVRRSAPVSLDASTDDDPPFDAADPTTDPERDARARELDALLDAAIHELPPQDGAIVRLKYGEGLSLRQICDALHLEELGEPRMRGILEMLKQRLAARRVSASDAAIAGLAFLERDPS
jgi:DNA-directed RNA polymerase specialized sigma24 family protein